jgi:hypothetical protein
MVDFLTQIWQIVDLIRKNPHCRENVDLRENRTFDQSPRGNNSKT